MLESAETIRGKIAGSMENTSANLDALRPHDENDENAATVPQLPAPDDKCLVVFRQGGVAVPAHELRQAIRKAKGALDPAQFLDNGRA